MRQFINSGRPVGHGSKAKGRPISFGRKLSVERMEDRLMLSATTAEVPTVDVKSLADFDSNLYFVSSLDRYTTNFAQVDGGLISMGSVNGTPTVTDNYVPNLDADSPLVFSGDSSAHGFSDSGGLNLWDIELSTSGTGGLQPITIVRSWPGGVLEASSSRATFTTAKTTIPEEGGSISLPTLIAGLRQEKTSQESSVGSAVATAKEVSTPSSPPSSPTSLSGEWARAAVFSMVGNERDGLTEQPLHRGRNMSAGEPDYSSTPAAATNGIPRGAAKPTATSDSASNPNKSPTVNEASSSATGKQEPRTSAVQSIRAVPVAAWRFDPQYAATIPLTTAVLMRDFVARDSAGAEDKRTSAHLTAAYDEIGNDSASAGNVFSANSLWRRRGVAAPLLLLLAVERIAALNSREAAKSTAAPKIGQPWQRAGVQR